MIINLKLKKKKQSFRVRLRIKKKLHNVCQQPKSLKMTNKLMLPVNLIILIKSGDA